MWESTEDWKSSNSLTSTSYAPNICSFMELLDFAPKEATMLLSYYEEIIKILEKAISDVALEFSKMTPPPGVTYTMKHNIKPRIMRITHCAEITKFAMPKASDIGKFVELSGTVIRSGTLKMLEYERTYQ